MGNRSAQLEPGPLSAGARSRRDEGMAVVVAIMAMLLTTALGAAITLTIVSETTIAANFRASVEAFYAADAAVERAIDDLRSVSDWTTVLSGGARSAFVDGSPEGTRRLADGSTIDLTRVVNMANCGKPTTCRESDMNAATAARPWGANNPRWQLYAYGDLDRMVPSSAAGSPYYVLAMVADDGSENDGDPLRDGADGANPGAGVLALRAEAFGAGGAHKTIEVTLAHPPAVRMPSWRVLR